MSNYDQTDDNAGHDLAASLVAERMSAVRRALDEVEQVREQLADAGVAACSAKDAAQRAVLRLGAAVAAADHPADHHLMRTLYWDYPEVSADTIARAFGLRAANEVYRVVGPDTREWPCRGGCGSPVVLNRESRTGRPWDRGSRDPRLCPACRERLVAEEREREVEWNRRRALERAEDEAVLEQLKAAISQGLTPSGTYIEYPGYRGAYRLDGDATGDTHTRLI